MGMRMLPLLVLTWTTAAAQAGEPLAWKWKEKDQFYVEYSTEFKETAKLLCNDIKQEEKLSGLFRITVKESLKDGVVLEVKAEKFDFTNLQAKPLIDEMKGAEFEVVLSDKMEILRIKGLDAVIKKVPGSDQLDKKSFNFLLTMLEGLNRTWITEAFLAMPNKEVKEGDSWGQRCVIDLPPIGTLTSRRTIKDAGAAKVEGVDMRKLTTVSTFSFAPFKGEDNILPFKIEEIEIKDSNCETTTYFDPAAGRIHKSETKQKYSTLMSLNVNGMKVEGKSEREQSHLVRFHPKKP